ncbi:UNVERIFIED_CONTAM: hypothetical protein Slati_0698300, partial [Sesamum latifolium]
MMGTLHRSGVLKKSNDIARVIVTTIMGMVLGYFMGVSFPSVSLSKINLPSSLMPSANVAFSDDLPTVTRTYPEDRVLNDTPPTPKKAAIRDYESHGSDMKSVFLIRTRIRASTTILILLKKKIYLPTNPRGAESLPPGIIVSESDFYLRRLWVTQMSDILGKLSGSEKEAEVPCNIYSWFWQLVAAFDNSMPYVADAMRWYAKRFLHPDVVVPYDYIFIWDEDLGVEHFDAEKYIELVKKHGLEISQPALEPNSGLTWLMTKKKDNREVHKDTEERPGWCSDPFLPPCAGFVEIMAPVFSREAWRCVWYLIQ